MSILFFCVQTIDVENSDVSNNNSAEDQNSSRDEEQVHAMLLFDFCFWLVVDFRNQRVPPMESTLATISSLEVRESLRQTLNRSCLVV